MRVLAITFSLDSPQNPVQRPAHMFELFVAATLQRVLLEIALIPQLREEQPQILSRLSEQEVIVMYYYSSLAPLMTVRVRMKLACTEIQIPQFPLSPAPQV